MGRDEDEFIQAAAGSMLQIQQRMAALFREDEAMNAEPGLGAFASVIGPMEINSDTVRRIKQLSTADVGSPNEIWYVHTVECYEEEGQVNTCTVHQVAKEHGSNGLSLPDSDGFGQSVAMCGLLDQHSTTCTRPHLLLGTIAKACLNPGKMGGLGVMPTQANEMFDIRPMRPRKILFQSRGELEMIAPDLRSWGIIHLAVADQALQRSLELFESLQNDAQYEADENAFRTREGLGRTLINQANLFHDPYVEEPDEPYDLGRWTPPNQPGDFPARWFAQAPDDEASYRPTSLCGWRTNLERAILREDAEKVKKIVAKRDPAMVREYVECRMLLTKCAQRGLIEACKLLILDCNASVEGAQAPDSESWWLGVQNASGNFDSLTPLHQASRHGQLESVRLLLDHGADVNRIDKSRIQGNALHHAISGGGHVDCIRFLCERGADLVYEGQGGDAIAISELVGYGDVYKERVQEKVQQILREFDVRCSYCKADDPPKMCPCKKERYCDADCQRMRWKSHKGYHKEVLRSK